MLQMIQRNTRILIQLVGEILDFRKVQNNKAKLRLNRFALSDELSTWAEDFRAAAARRKITIIVVTAGAAETSTADDGNPSDTQTAQ